MNTISGIVIAKNEENMIADCLDSLSFCDEVIVVDGGSEDRTVEIVLRSKIPLRGTKRMGAKVFTFKSDDFSELRNFGLEKAKGDWILYIDADERVSKELKEEITHLTTIHDRGQQLNAYSLKRNNFYLGSSKKNEWPHIEKIERLFKRGSLRGWKGKLHESPVLEGEVGELEGFLLHYTHRNLSEMLAKTIEWSKVEAELRFKAGHPQMVWWRFLRVMITAFFDWYIRQKGFKAGTVGLIESVYQMFSMFITYARLWEMQQRNATSSQK